MGGQTFAVKGRGKSPDQAFNALVTKTLTFYGLRGYTGTIAEKDSFVMIPIPAGVDPEDYADTLLDAGDERVDDKYGPAGCIDCGDGTYLFFGWASC